MTLFRVVLATLLFVPLFAVSALAQSSYLVRSGDVLQLEVLEDSSLNRNLLVLPDGQVTVPFVGSVPAQGRTIAQIRQSITSGLAPSFADTPTVFVGISALKEVPTVTAAPSVAPAPITIAVYVIGEVADPGKKEIEPGTTILQFLAEMGGFSQFAATKRIQLRTSRSGQEQVYSLNYEDIERGAGIGTSTVMADGDVIVVPQRRLFE